MIVLISGVVLAVILAIAWNYQRLGFPSKKITSIVESLTSQYGSGREASVYKQEGFTVPQDQPPVVESRVVQCGEDQIHYLQAGQGSHVVLLHGIGASVYTWRYMLQDLARHYTVTALDLPGFGKSSKHIAGSYGLDQQRTRLLSFLDTVGIGPARLVGSSMGATIALWMAHENPKRFSEVVALAPATNPTIVPRRLSKWIARAPYINRTLNPSTMKLILRQIIGREELLAPETVQAYLEPFLDNGDSLRTFLSAMELLGDPRLPACYEGIESRVLILQGQRDRMVSVSSVERLRSHIPCASLEFHATAGHHIMEDAPEWTVERILQFFSK